MFCVNCGKEIVDGASFCPECGAAQQGTTPPSLSATDSSAVTDEKAPYNSMCIIGLVVSIISLFLNFFGIVGIAGTVLSVIGLTGCNRKKESGKGFAVVGIIIGVFSIIYGTIAIMSI